ncbi:porin [Polynucleobacter sp. 15G-AUS-farblos]|uniref:porin n=1 Tax=Polynucleobacter sp. 15G-AUS-farblos TaxID=2689094 RepID=UPI001C0E3A61|nr:porin [Polynucleobacter sp. 15G-AUS-farblos]MBU3583933.1 porin [Polynucleobacter sp. 15G-AUS-farblos]
MKKSLLAVAALSAIAGAAQAQSSVTIYGVLDAGYVNQKSDGAGSNSRSNASNSLIASSAEQTSRLGFKGTEDLGGGTSAIFTVETGLQVTNATASAWNNRQSFVGLKKNGTGQFTLGTQYTPAFQALSATDVGQTNNMVGSAVYPQEVPTGNGNTGVASYRGSDGTSGTSNAITVRTTSTIQAQSDKFAGFSLGASYTQNGSTVTNTNTSAVSNNWTGWGLKADYTWNKLYVVAAANRLKSSNTGPVANNNPAAATAWTGAGGGLQSQDNQFYAAATYDFGILKAYLQYINKKVSSTVNANYYAQRNAQQIGVRSYITPTIEGWANIGNGSTRTFGVGSVVPKANFVAWQAGLNYYLSKRTNVYGIYGTNNMSSAQPVNPALNVSAFAVGVRHTF